MWPSTRMHDANTEDTTYIVEPQGRQCQLPRQSRGPYSGSATSHLVLHMETIHTPRCSSCSFTSHHPYDKREYGPQAIALSTKLLQLWTHSSHGSRNSLISSMHDAPAVSVLAAISHLLEAGRFAYPASLVFITDMWYGRHVLCFCEKSTLMVVHHRRRIYSESVREELPL